MTLLGCKRASRSRGPTVRLSRRAPGGSSASRTMCSMWRLRKARRMAQRQQYQATLELGVRTEEAVDAVASAVATVMPSAVVSASAERSRMYVKHWLRPARFMDCQIYLRQALKDSGFRQHVWVAREENVLLEV